MILSVDLSSQVPLYQQLRDRVVEGIASGQLAAGTSLPASRALAADFGINFHTVTRAYDLLRQQGLVRLTRKTGAVVQRDARSGPPAFGFAEEWEARLRTLLAEAVAQGMPGGDVLDHCQAVLATFQTAGTGGGTSS
jgi:DNA-binding transcriptional regulator YhcF (GntR family)